MGSLPTQVRSAVGQPATVRIGVVVSASPFTVNVQGATFTNVGVLGSYTPVAGDTVALLGQSPQSGSDPTSWLALGSSLSTPAPVDAAVAVRDFKSTLVTTVSVPFVLTGTVCGVSFTAPFSGKILLTWRSQIFNNTAAGFGYCSPGITEGAVPGAGTVFLAPLVTLGVAVTGTLGMEFGSSDLITGLTPSLVYSVALWQRSSAGANTASFLNRGVVVVPVP